MIELPTHSIRFADSLFHSEYISILNHLPQLGQLPIAKTSRKQVSLTKLSCYFVRLCFKIYFLGGLTYSLVYGCSNLVRYEHLLRLSALGSFYLLIVSNNVVDQYQAGEIEPSAYS